MMRQFSWEWYSQIQTVSTNSNRDNFHLCDHAYLFKTTLEVLNCNLTIPYQDVLNASVFDMHRKITGIPNWEMSSIFTSDKLEYDEGILTYILISLVDSCSKKCTIYSKLIKLFTWPLKRLRHFVFIFLGKINKNEKFEMQTLNYKFRVTWSQKIG